MKIEAANLSDSVQGILFDMDGVVIDSERLYTCFWIEAAQEFGYAMTMEQALSLRSIGIGQRQALLEQYFGPGIDQGVIRARRNAMVDAFLGEGIVEAKPGIYALLDYLDAKGIPAAITTSADQERVRQQLTPLNLYHRFAKICSSTQVPNRKPAPDIYLYGAKQLGLEPKFCMAIEDSPPGVISAYRAGCLPVVIPDMDQPSEEICAMAYARVDSLYDVISLLDIQF